LADLGVEEAGVDEAFGDAFFAGEELLALEATDVRKPFFESFASRHVRSRGRVEETADVRFGLL
jgi:hypothetical protein